MKKTINVGTVTRVALIPIRESKWKIIPAYEYIPSIFEDVVGFITRKPVQVPERVGADYLSYSYTMEDFAEYEKTRFISKGKVYEMAQVYMEFTSGNSMTRHFGDDEKAKDFYDALSYQILNRLMYDEEISNIQ